MKLGIDYGTTTTLVSFARTEKPQLINIGGSRMGYMRSSIPSVIRVKKDGSTAIGYEAEALAEKAPNEGLMLRSLKRCLGCDVKPKGPFDGCWNRINRQFCLGGQRFSIFKEQVSAKELVTEFLRGALELPEVNKVYKQKGLEAIGVSVPALFGKTARQNVYDILLENLKIKIAIDIINEPTAAVKGCQKTMLSDEDGVYAIIDIGGGTTDIVLYEKRETNYFLFKPRGVRLGGDDLDEALLTNYYRKGITRDLKQHATREKKIDQETELSDSALMEVRRAKERLTIVDEVTLFGKKLRRADFEKMARPVLSPAVKALREEIKKVFDIYKPSSITKQKFKLNRVYLSGGGSRIPLIKKMIQDDEIISIFGADVDFVRDDELFKIYKEDVPIVAVALGASMPKKGIQDSIQYMLPYAIHSLVEKQESEIAPVYGDLPIKFKIVRRDLGDKIRLRAVDPSKSKVVYDMTEEMITDGNESLSEFMNITRCIGFEFQIDEYNIMRVTAVLPKKPIRAFALPWQGGIETAAFEKYRREWRRKQEGLWG